MKFRSKPTEIEAEQYLGKRVPGVRFSTAIDCQSGEVTESAFVTTIQGVEVPISKGEWIVREPDGVHYYPIADEVFRAKYEAVGARITKLVSHSITVGDGAFRMPAAGDLIYSCPPDQRMAVVDSRPWWKRWWDAIVAKVTDEYSKGRL